MRRTRVCAVVGCHHIRPCPVPGHERPKNSSWSKDRNRQQQHRFRLAVLGRDSYTCQRCGHHDPSGRSLEAHHVRPGYEAYAGTTLCNRQANDCHGAVDNSAR